MAMKLAHLFVLCSLWSVASSSISSKTGAGTVPTLSTEVEEPEEVDFKENEEWWKDPWALFEDEEGDEEERGDTSTEEIIEIQQESENEGEQAAVDTQQAQQDDENLYIMTPETIEEPPLPTEEGPDDLLELSIPLELEEFQPSSSEGIEESVDSLEQHSTVAETEQLEVEEILEEAPIPIMEIVEPVEVAPENASVDPTEIEEELVILSDDDINKVLQDQDLFEDEAVEDDDDDEDDTMSPEMQERLEKEAILEAGKRALLELEREAELGRQDQEDPLVLENEEEIVENEKEKESDDDPIMQNEPVEPLVEVESLFEIKEPVREVPPAPRVETREEPIADANPEVEDSSDGWNLEMSDNFIPDKVAEESLEEKVHEQPIAGEPTAADRPITMQPIAKEPLTEELIEEEEEQITREALPKETVSVTDQESVLATVPGEELLSAGDLESKGEEIAPRIQEKPIADEKPPQMESTDAIKPKAGLGLPPTFAKVPPVQAKKKIASIPSNEITPPKEEKKKDLVPSTKHVTVLASDADKGGELPLRKVFAAPLSLLLPMMPKIQGVVVQGVLAKVLAGAVVLKVVMNPVVTFVGKIRSKFFDKDEEIGESSMSRETEREIRAQQEQEEEYRKARHEEQLAASRRKLNDRNAFMRDGNEDNSGSLLSKVLARRRERLPSSRELMEQVETLQRQAHTASADRDHMEREYEKASWLVSGGFAVIACYRCLVN